MAKPTENKEDKNPNSKIEMNQNTVLMVNNAILIVVLVITMIIMYVLLDNSFTKKIAKLAPQQEEQLDEEGDEVKEEGVLLDLGEFILNLADTNQRRYLKAGVAVELSKTEEEIAATNNPKAEKPSGHGEAAADPTAAIATEMERYKPAIRDAVISVLSNKTSDELSTSTGKEVAKEEILNAINGVFEGEREVIRVSFGQFIIQ